MRILSVLEITAYLKEIVEFDPVLSDVWVRGEITNLSTSAAGHSYFSLTADSVQLNCVLFKGSRARVLAFPRNGDAVLAHGRFSIYESRGHYQLIVDNVAPEGIGILQLQFDDTRRRLEAEGLFSVDRKRPLPEMASVIGVVTSEQGAVWHDIQNVITRRFPLVRLMFAPSAVQGPTAAEDLIAALQALDASSEPDVIIIGRGGGSMEDLAAFSDEALARAIFRCKVPVVSAVGHETDSCIADLVADVRAPTPSAAAELCVPDQRALLAQAGQCVRDARLHVTRAALSSRASIGAAGASLASRNPMTRVNRAQQDVDSLVEQATAYALDAAAHQRELVARATDRAILLNPSDVLRRGYAVVSATQGNGTARIALASDAMQHDELTVTFSDGAVNTRRVRG
ncbi:MAG TPA: exodeoxyribonuclease VII large subunit [Thermomicrobiales bacterium]|nr:exodeoxyribonuclease VII large subunit [Thermomicrobiales bacterium]